MMKNRFGSKRGSTDPQQSDAGTTIFYGTPGDDHFSADKRAINVFHLENGGDDTVIGNRRTGLCYFGSSYDENDKISGFRNLYNILDGDYSFGLNLTGNVESGTVFNLYGNFKYKFVLDKDVGGSAYFVESPGALLYLDASEAKTSISARGGRGSDRIIGGHRADTIALGSGRPDIVSGGEGNDVFYQPASSDRHIQRGTITDFTEDDVLFLERHKYHMGLTSDHIGDVIIEYHAKQDFTTVNIFTDRDDRVDFILTLDGHFNDIMISGSALTVI